MFFLDQFAQIRVGRRHHSDVHPETVRAAQSLHFALLQKSQQLGLQAQRQFADFIEEKRSALRRVNSSDARLHRSGERSLGVAEQFSLEQRFGNSGAVDYYKWIRSPRTEIVNGLRHQIFAGAAFSQDQAPWYRAAPPVASCDTRAASPPKLPIIPGSGLTVLVQLFVADNLRRARDHDVISQ